MHAPFGQPDPMLKLAELEGRLGQFHGGLLQMWRHLLRVRRSVSAMEARERLAAAGRKEHLPLEFRSQFGEDLTAWDILGKPLDGFFIEVGAFDGVSYSTTYALEAMGWTGLLVEAIPERFEACRRNRPNSRVVHAALAAPGAGSETVFHVMQDEYGGMLSFGEGISEGQHVEKMRSSSLPKTTLKVPLTTLDGLLDGHTGAVDLVMIDVEGAEVALLKGFNIARWKPRVVLIEDGGMGNSPELDALMARHPYSHVGWVESSRVYVRSDERELLERAREAV